MIIRDFLNSQRIIHCAKCGTHLTSPSELISKVKHFHLIALYQFRSFKAPAAERPSTTKCTSFLPFKIFKPFSINVEEGDDFKRHLTTGEHVIRDIICCFCDKKLGWRYVSTTEPSQMYKIGHYILELAYVKEADNKFAGFPAIDGYVELDLLH